MILKLNILVFTAVTAFRDLKWWKVKNLWLLAGAGGGVFYQLFYSGSPGILQGLFGMVVPALLLGFFWYHGLIGAADVRFLRSLFDPV